MIIDEEDYLAHHGTKGMKWGVRRHRSTFPNVKKTAEKTLANRVKKADRINRLVNKAETRSGIRPIFVRPKYNVPSAITPTFRSLIAVVPGMMTYSSAGFVRRINKEFGGHSYKDILEGEGVVVTRKGEHVTQNILKVNGAAKLPPETVKAFKLKANKANVKNVDKLQKKADKLERKFVKNDPKLSKSENIKDLKKSQKNRRINTAGMLRAQP